MGTVWEITYIHVCIMIVISFLSGFYVCNNCYIVTRILLCKCLFYYGPVACIGLNKFELNLIELARLTVS